MLVFMATACKPMQEPLITGQRLDLGLTSSDVQPDLLFHTRDDAVALTLADRHGRTIGDSPDEITYVTLEGIRQKIVLERLFECDYAVYYSAFLRLADGRLALRGYCTKIAPQRAASYLLAHDASQQTTSLLIPSMLPIDDSKLFAWNPSVTRAIVSFGSLYSGLYWIDTTGAAKAVTGTVEANGKAFSLEIAYVGFNRDGVADTGNATAPAWSPDGSTIAFFASTDSINRRGTSRITGSWLLCLMDVQSLKPKVVLKNVYRIGKPRWSSDGRFIAFNGQVGSNGSEGLWVYSVANSETKLVAEGTFSDFIWSADDERIYGIRSLDDNVLEKEVWRFDLGNILSSPTTPMP
jgi:hypothetical protein